MPDALLDVQISMLYRHGPVDAVTAHRLRRARTAVIAETLRWYTRQFNVTNRAA
ncbi:MAG TPA: hypothetical protein VL738_21575 [Dactylosporangium sp.]|nr:hypothetical protein [Dactylosporangium sp.]